MKKVVCKIVKVDFYTKDGEKVSFKGFKTRLKQTRRKISKLTPDPDP